MNRLKLLPIALLVTGGPALSLHCTPTEYKVGSEAIGSLDGSAEGGSAGGGGGSADGGAASCSCDYPRTACVARSCVEVQGRKQLAVGINSACAIHGGQLYCWGRQFGSRPFEVWETPLRKGTGSDWQAISTNVGQVYCVLNGLGELYCWGDANAHLNLGRNESSTELLRIGTSNYSAVFMGSGHGCALDREQRLACWGRNVDGELGQGDTIDRGAPTLIEGYRFATVAVGWGHTCAIDENARLYCWGRNAEGQLGLGSTNDALSPTRVGTDSWRQVFAGDLNTCAIKLDGGVMCWGDGSNGRLGTGDELSRLEPASSVSWPAQSISLGLQRTCMSNFAGQYRCFGLSGTGELDKDTGAPEGGLFAQEISAGSASSCLLGGTDQQDQEVYCWGTNASFALGLGDQTPRALPERVELPE